MNYIGIDIGDGESCVCVLPYGSDIEPRPITITGRKSFISAVALDEKGDVVIGQDAINLGTPKDLSVRFKSRFLKGDPIDERDMERFLKGISQHLRKENLLAKNDKVTVGCPAGWSNEARSRYLSMLQRAGFPNVSLVSESRAAFLYAKHTRTIQLDGDWARENALVIDIGSSTLDFAHVRDGRETNVGTFGDVYLGGGAIDEALLTAAVEASPLKSSIYETFSEAPQWRSFCLLATRYLKEEYFTRQSAGEKNIQCNDAVTLLYDLPIVLPLMVNDPMIWRIIHLGVDALGGDSFFRMLEKALISAQMHTQDCPPQLVLLTGGASRMQFFQELCHKYFPKSHMILCEEPEFSISKGLAYSTRVDEDILFFNEEIDTFVKTDRIAQAVQKRMPDLISRLSQCIAEVAYLRAQEHVNLWRDGKHKTLEDMNRAITRDVEASFAASQTNGAAYSAIQSKMEEVCLDLQPDIDNICNKHGVACSQMRLVGTTQLPDASETAAFSVGAEMTFLERTVQATVTALVAGVMLLIPGGWIIDAAVIVTTALAALFGRNVVNKFTSTMNIPKIMRARISGEKIINESTYQKILKGFEERFSQSEQLTHSVASSIEESIADYVRRMAQKTEIAIASGDEASGYH